MAIMSSTLSFSTAVFISADHGPLRTGPRPFRSAPWQVC